MSDHGTYTTVDGVPALCFERRLGHPLDPVWRAVSDPEQLARWFPQLIAEPVLRVGGTVTFSFPGDDAPSGVGEVVELDVGRRLAFTWFGELLRIELEPAGRETILRFSQHVTVEPDAAARSMAGWHVCLDVLGRALDGEETSGPGSEPTATWRAHYDHYVAAGIPSGAPIPSGT